MCTNYEPVMDNAGLLAAFGLTLPEGIDAAPCSKAGVMAPFIVRSEHRAPEVLGDLEFGLLGLLPNFATSVDDACNARGCDVETMKSQPTFRESWWAGRRCVIPVKTVAEWCYETRPPERYAVGLADGEPMGLAGLWNEWTSPDGEKLMSFCMLTLDAEGHPVFQRMHGPGQAKRMPVILPRSKQASWLHSPMRDAERLLVRCPAEDLHAVPMQRSARALKEPAGWAVVQDMFEDEWHVTATERPRKPPSRARPAMPSEPPGLSVPTTGDLFG